MTDMFSEKFVSMMEPFNALEHTMRRRFQTPESAAREAEIDACVAAANASRLLYEIREC